jgi:hypothetical protein
VMAVPRPRAAYAVLRNLSALGARIERRGDKIVLRVGDRPVPSDLHAAAREAKVQLSKMLNNGEGEHLRRPEAEHPSFPAASVEGAQPSENERLRAGLSNFGNSTDFRPLADEPEVKMLTEDAHLSTFDGGVDFCGFPPGTVSKVLNSTHVSALGPDEHLRGSRREVWPERPAIVEQLRAIPCVGIPDFLDGPVLLSDGPRLWRFLQAQDCAPDRAATLIDQAHCHGTVLVADGRELIVVERWLSSLPLETLCGLRRCAGTVIATLHRRPHLRYRKKSER